MGRSVSILFSIGFFLVLCAIYWFWIMKGSKLVRKKKPAAPKPTMFDVRRLLQEGDREGAIKLYTQIFKLPIKKARKDIEELERNLKV